jgi:hypothetical protein
MHIFFLKKVSDIVCINRKSEYFSKKIDAGIFVLTFGRGAPETAWLPAEDTPRYSLHDLQHGMPFSSSPLALACPAAQRGSTRGAAAGGQHLGDPS